MTIRKTADVEVRRVAIYTRKSTTHGLATQEFSSLDAQWDVCENYVRTQPGWELVDARYDDGGFTGANTERPAFQRLLADVDAGRVDVVVVYKIDRLSRSLLDFASLMERFRKSGAYFVSVTQPFLSADNDAMAQLLLNILMAFAQFERQMIAERIRDKVGAARRKGMWTGGMVPYGYRTEERKLKIVSDEARVVREMYRSFIACRSDADVVRMLRTELHRTRKGRVWTRQAVARVLSNPLYAGFMTLGDELHPGEHEPIVDRELFERVQALRAATTEAGAASERNGRQRNPSYLLRGLLFCGCSVSGSKCGYSLTPSSARKNKKQYRYYRCISRDKAEACGARPLNAVQLEELVLERVADVARAFERKGRGRSGSIEQRLQLRAGEQRKATLAERAELRERLKQVSHDVRSLDANLEAADTINAALLEQRRDVKLAERTQLKEQLREVEVRLAKLESLTLDAGWVAAQLRDFRAVWGNLLPRNQLKVVRAVIARVDVDEPNGDVRITLHPWVSEALQRSDHAA